VLSVITATAVQVGAQDAQTSSSATPSESSGYDIHIDPQRLIAEHFAMGEALLRQGQYAKAQAEFREVLQLDATHPAALRLMTTAQKALEAAQAEAVRNHARLRKEAERLAAKIVREKSAAIAKHATQTRAQIADARDRELKMLYKRGMALYRQGEFDAAVSVFQQLAPLAPEHPLVRDAQRWIVRAETQLAGHRAHAARSGAAPGVAELERELAERRLEIDTLLKHAKMARKDGRLDQTVDWLQRALALDPGHPAAQALLHDVQLAKLKDTEEQLTRRVLLDEQAMRNDVMKAQMLPPVRVMPMKGAVPASAPVQQAMADKLRQPITLEFTDVPLADVLDFIADAASISIVPSPQLDLKTRRVSLNVREAPLAIALKYLAKNQALAYRVTDYAVLIAAPEEFTNEAIETRVFFLRNGLGPFALTTAALEPNPALTMESIKDLIQRTVPQPPDSKLVVDERSGALIISNTAEHLRLVERLLSQLDVTPLQVLIEARFIELTLSDLEHLGVESILTGDLALKKTGAAVGGQGPGHAVASGGGVKFPALSRESEGANVTLQGVLTGVQFEAVLHLLEESQKSKTLSAPRVTTLNNQTATIRVVDEFNYPTRYQVSLIQFDTNGDGDFDDAGETEFANVPQDLQKRDIGILLNVTPSVGKDLKTITLVLAPEVSQFSQFRSLGGGVTVPEFTSSQLTTSIQIEDGQTVVLGGLMKDTTTETLTKVPFFGNLPVVGGLFRQREDTSTRKNLLIFITARLLAPRGQTT